MRHGDDVIARYRAVQQIQDDRVARWTARGRVDYHFKLAASGSRVDVGIDCNYFWERGRDLEWEQTDYYVNGNRVTWKSIPELPLVQPEKVVTLPLDLTLDRTYAYELQGEDDVDGRPAYVLAFEPVESKADAALYRGRVWIDRASFLRLKAQVVQTNLDPPVVSNEETDVYAPVSSPDGDPVWLLSRVVVSPSRAGRLPWRGR